MPKPILNVLDLEKQKLDLNNQARSSFVSSDLAFRQKRSSKYIELLKLLDTSGNNISQVDIDKIVSDIKNELGEIGIGQIPLGIVSKCYLGNPYEVHTLTLVGTIIKHYKFGESLPPELEKARNLAFSPKYAFIEVYTDRLVAINKDGSAAEIKNN
ncbi:MAG: hypothetical protein LBN20_04225 [Endomicrobium sp.]|jgi:hypothetical protein|nr:hypothetical protein [Endomicrobium sp.]